MACTRVIQCDESVRCIAIAHDGQLLAVGLNGDFGGGGGVLLLDRRTMLTKRFSCNALSVAFAPASTSPLLLATGFSNGTVRVRDCSSGACVVVLKGHSEAVNGVAFSKDSRLLASASRDGTVRLWRTDNWRAPPDVLRGHDHDVNRVSFSCDGRLLVSCSKDDTLRLWRLHYLAAATAAVPTVIAVASPTLKVDRHPLFCAAFSPVDSRLFACGGSVGFLALTNAGACDGSIAVKRKLQGHTEAVRSLAFSPCGQTLSSASEDNTVRLWSVASGARLRVLRGHRHIKGMAFFPNGKHLALSGSCDRAIHIWMVCAWSDTTHRYFSAPLKRVVFTLMCVRARLEQEQQGQEQGGQHALQFPRLPMEVWLLVFGQLQLALEG